MKQTRLSASFDNDEDSREFVKCKIESLLATQDRKQPEGNICLL